MSRTAAPIDRDGAHDHDPWWGAGAASEAATEPAVRDARRAPRPRRTGIGWLLLGLLVAPFDLFGRLLRRSPRLRRVVMRLAVVAAILAVLTCSVGVILINNVVIGRTAELGELEDRRRELRRDNAVLGAQAAGLETPGIVYRRATRDLGMVRTENVPEFVYLYDASRMLTEHRRRRLAAAAAKRREAAVAAAAAEAASAKEGDQ